MSKISINDLERVSTLDDVAMQEHRGGRWSHHSLGVPGGYWWSGEYVSNNRDSLEYPGNPDSPKSQPTFGVY